MPQSIWVHESSQLMKYAPNSVQATDNKTKTDMTIRSIVSISNVESENKRKRLELLFRTSPANSDRVELQHTIPNRFVFRHTPHNGIDG
ncbi:hypothetical protein VNO78_04194 [Psophocarpus tetragonolobus]|uniref:Uncharacterized protein n=1 Tax=Psophocarpus tetragonolobus TaxID=3891 RepID=A0AAN9T1M7_PSOTE